MPSDRMTFNRQMAPGQAAGRMASWKDNVSIRSGTKLRRKGLSRSVHHGLVSTRILISLQWSWQLWAIEWLFITPLKDPLILCAQIAHPLSFCTDSQDPCSGTDAPGLEFSTLPGRYISYLQHSSLSTGQHAMSQVESVPLEFNTLWINYHYHHCDFYLSSALVQHRQSQALGKRLAYVISIFPQDSLTRYELLTPFTGQKSEAQRL